MSGRDDDLDGNPLVYVVGIDWASDPLHPTGRCSCGGEGQCEWCRVPCTDCGQPRIVCSCEPLDLNDSNDWVSEP